MRSHWSKTALSGWSAGIVLAASALITTGGVAQAATCTTTPSTVVPGIQITDPSCNFAPDVPGASLYSGILHGSAYRIEIPPNWNGALVMYAHGYAGTGNVVTVGNPQIAQWYAQNGYAWAASSYRRNGYNVGDGVEDTHDLMVHFSGLTQHRAPTETYMTGVSMGGEITGVEIEKYKSQYTAAMPMCGVLGANHLFDYFLGANATAAALTNAPLQYPLTQAAGTAYTPVFDQLVHQTEMPGLGIAVNPTPPPSGIPAFIPAFNTAAGQEWVAAVEQMSGGTRAGGPAAVAYWSSFGFAPLTDIPFLFGLYPGLTGGTIGYADGNVASNIGTTYQLDNDPAVSPQEAALNASVIRVAATNTATTNPARTELPDIAGNPRIPVLSLHDTGDLFVPIKMDQIYAQEVAAHGSNLFVDRAIRGFGHCEFSNSEVSTGFSDLVQWVHTGQRAQGDDILNPQTVAGSQFACRFTDPTAPQHALFRALVGPCPGPTT